MKQWTTWLLGMTLGMLTACGGGGGGGGGLGNVTFNSISITPGNAETVGAVVIDSTDTVQGSTGGSNFLLGVTVGSTAASFSFAEFARQQLGRVQALAGLNGVTGVNFGTIDCTDNGFVRVSGFIADATGNTLTAGDSLQLDFVNCDEMGVILNGGFGMGIASASPDPFTGNETSIALTLDTSLNNFSANDGLVTVTAHGDMTLAIDDDGAGNVMLGLSGSSLAATDGTDTIKVTNYNYQIATTSIGNFTANISGTIGSSALDGSVSFQTTTDFTGNDFVANGNATAGDLLITSDLDNTSEILTAQPDGINVVILVDTDGDTIYETTIMTTWTALQAI